MLVLEPVKHLFKLGQVCLTAAAEDLRLHEGLDVSKLLSRHVSGDWGDLCEDDKNENTNAIQDGNRIFSSYIVKDQKIWIITEWDRSLTTVLLPSDYRLALT